MKAIVGNVLSFSLSWVKIARPVMPSLALAFFSHCCFGQIPADIALPSEIINSGNPVFEATNSITNSASFVVQGPASVTFAAGSSITLQPGFDAVAGGATFTFFATADSVITQPPSDGVGLPSIPYSYTAPTYSPTCDNISGQWLDSDNVGNSIGWDLNQTGNSIAGTLSFDDYRNSGVWSDLLRHDKVHRFRRFQWQRGLLSLGRQSGTRDRQLWPSVGPVGSRSRYAVRSGVRKRSRNLYHLRGWGTITGHFSCAPRLCQFGNQPDNECHRQPSSITGISLLRPDRPGTMALHRLQAALPFLLTPQPPTSTTDRMQAQMKIILSMTAGTGTIAGRQS